MPRDAIRDRENNQRWIRENRERYNRSKREYRYRLKLEALAIYGNGVVACVQCGFSDARALVIDHVNDDGKEHRRALKVAGTNSGSGTNIHEALKARGWPNDPPLQTLCANCNLIKEIERKRQ